MRGARASVTAMTKLLAASLLALSVTAVLADPSKPPDLPHPPPVSAPPECSKAGGVLLEQQLEVEPHVATTKVRTWTTTVFDGGAWERHDVDASGHNAGISSGCLSAAQRSAIKSALAKATWQVSPSDVACSAVSATFTSYRLRGKPVWAAHLCQAQALDQASATAIATIDALLAAATAPTTPPCCKK